MTATQIDTDKLQQLGNLWENHGKRRIYFDDLPRLFGLEIDYYKTGNISNVWIRPGSPAADVYGDGRISNSRGRTALTSIPDKLWYDLDAEKFAWRGGTTERGEAIAAELAKLVS